jgi:hypothetical protein
MPAEHSAYEFFLFLVAILPTEARKRSELSHMPVLFPAFGLLDAAPTSKLDLALNSNKANAEAAPNPFVQPRNMTKRTLHQQF